MGMHYGWLIAAWFMVGRKCRGVPCGMPSLSKSGCDAARPSAEAGILARKSVGSQHEHLVLDLRAPRRGIFDGHRNRQEIETHCGAPALRALPSPEAVREPSAPGV